MNLAQRLGELARTRGQQVAIMSPRGSLTFAEFDREAQRVAALLGERGARVGQRALILTPLGSELYVTLIALWRIGLVAVVVDPGAGVQHLRAALRRVQPDLLIGVPLSFALLALPEVRRIPLRVHVGGWLPGAQDWHATPTLPPAPLPLALPPEHPALLTFTSGSTGQPKAAQRTHGFLQQQHRVLERHLGYIPAQTDLVTLPVVGLASLASGRSVLLPDTSLKRPAEIDARRILRQLARHPADTVAASPALLHTLAEVAQDTGQRLPMTRIFAGGGPVFPRTLELLRQVAPHAELLSVYGSTEVEPIAHQLWQEVTPADQRRTQQGAGLLAGHVVDELQALIVPEGQTTPQGANLAPLTPGELWVSGPHVLPGYLNAQDNQGTKWQDPQTGQIWHRTGDAAQWDDQGRLWLLGRAGKAVQDAHGKLYPFAVEAAAMTCPSVRRAALLPQTRILLVEWADQPDPNLAKALAWAKLQDLREVAEIPLDRRHNAKVDYTRLQKMYGKG